MSIISMDSKDLSEILVQLEKAMRLFDSVGCVLEASMFENEIQKYDDAEWILKNIIRKLNNSSELYKEGRS